MFRDNLKSQLGKINLIKSRCYDLAFRLVPTVIARQCQTWRDIMCVNQIEKNLSKLDICRLQPIVTAKDIQGRRHKVDIRTYPGFGDYLSTRELIGLHQEARTEVNLIADYHNVSLLASKYWINGGPLEFRPNPYVTERQGIECYLLCDLIEKQPEMGRIMLRNKRIKPWAFKLWADEAIEGFTNGLNALDESE